MISTVKRTLHLRQVGIFPDENVDRYEYRMKVHSTEGSVTALTILSASLSDLILPEERSMT